MMNQQHVLTQLSDYILDLLPGDERQRVERHTAVCAQCRQALQRENRSGAAVRQTLTVATQPPPGRLMQLMPAAPRRARRLAVSTPLWRFAGYRQLAAIALLLILVVGAVFLSPGSNGARLIDLESPWYSQPGVDYLSPVYLAATATMTREPTATLAEHETIRMDLTAVSTTVTPTETVLTPSPGGGDSSPSPAPAIATPVAAMLNLSSN